MTGYRTPTPDPARDLEIERIIKAPAALVWRGWTEPELLKRWWAPKPVKTILAEIDLRPGGKFRTVMRLPDGQEMDGTGVFLVVEPEARLIWTDQLQPGFRPQPIGETGYKLGFGLTAIFTFAPHPEGTRYHALVLHGSPEKRAAHAAMGFYDGWGTCIGQLAALAEGWAKG